MLSRVADSLYWLSRYFERSENIARILDVNLQLLLDFQDLDDDRLKEHWLPIIESNGSEDLFQDLYDAPTSENVTNFLTFDERNPGSLINSLSAARENARMIRDKISSEMWETLNKLYLFVKSENAHTLWQSGPYDFYEHIKRGSHYFQGLTDATFPHGEGWEFIQVGKYLERADRSSRILDLKYHILLPTADGVGGAVDAAQWMAILRSASAFEAYHHVFASGVEPWKIADFLILSPTFPRSIRFCIKSVDSALRCISGTQEGNFSNEAEKLCGKLLAELQYTTPDDIFAKGLHEYLDDLQARFTTLGGKIYETYMFSPVINMAEEIQQQQQQQQ